MRHSKIDDNRLRTEFNEFASRVIMEMKDMIIGISHI